MNFQAFKLRKGCEKLYESFFKSLLAIEVKNLANLIAYKHVTDKIRAFL